jgi:hypothetical protein
MSTPEEDKRTRRRWIGFGETIAVIGVIISAVALWKTWDSSDKPAPAVVVEKRQPIPLTLRAKAQNEGRTLEISPVEPGHALQSLVITLGKTTINVGSDGDLAAADVENALKDRDENKGPHSTPVRIDARYVEAGADRRGGGSYLLRYRWEGGGLFGGRSIKLVGLSRG